MHGSYHNYESYDAVISVPSHIGDGRTDGDGLNDLFRVPCQTAKHYKNVSRYISISNR